jgi:Protease inhibitor Inh
MTSWKRAGVSIAGLATLALLLAGCTSSRIATRNVGAPEQLQPVPTSQVASTNLPAIGASGAVTQNQLPDGTIQTAAIGTPVGSVDPALSGQPVLGGAASNNTVQTASADGSFVTLDSVGSVPDAPGRDLSGGLTIEKLLGGWTIVSGAEQCKLNLTYTSKSGTSRYRASTPGCQLQGLKVVASWQLAGSQVQLFDENGDMIAALILSGNRFIGTLAGGQGISMVG